MTVLSECRWYVAHTQPLAEMKAAAHLKRQDFDVYVPRYLKRRRHARRIETVAAPLFPRYVFVSMDIAAQRWRSIHSTVGVSRLVCNGDVPTPVPQEVIEAVRLQEDDLGFVRLGAPPRFKAGDKVRILDGVFSSCMGLFEAATDRDRVAILLDLMGRKIRLVLDLESVVAA